MTTAIIFSGQGTQAPGMGAPWRAHPSWGLVERAEEAAGEPLGALLLTAPAEGLARTREAQLAVFLTSLVAWDAAEPTLPDAVAFAGHSLGQLTALVAAGALTLEQGLELVKCRADLTQAAADRRPGRMVALLGATPDQAEEASRAAPGACWVANDNAPGQIVLAGSPTGVDRAAEAARDVGVRRVMPVNVAGAFHTPLMAEAATAFTDVLSTTGFDGIDAPVVCNTDGQPHHDGGGWRSRLAEHLVRPVLWRQSMETMLGLGVDSFVEVGPGGVVAALARRCAPDADVRTVSTPDHLLLPVGTP